MKRWVKIRKDDLDKLSIALDRMAGFIRWGLDILKQLDVDEALSIVKEMKSKEKKRIESEKKKHEQKKGKKT